MPLTSSLVAVEEALVLAIQNHLSIKLWSPDTRRRSYSTPDCIVPVKSAWRSSVATCSVYGDSQYVASNIKGGKEIKG